MTLFSLLKTAFADSEQKQEPAAERLALLEIDSQIASVAERKARLEIQRQELSDDLDALGAERHGCFPTWPMQTPLTPVWRWTTWPKSVAESRWQART